MAVEPNFVYQEIAAPGIDGIMTKQTMAGAAVTGIPFSATQEQHRLQILGDGTRIEQTETSQFIRDSQGRTRIEASHAPGEGSSFVSIQDPVAGTGVVLNSGNKSANPVAFPKMVRAYSVAGAAPAGLPAPPPPDEAKRMAEMAAGGAGAGMGMGGTFNVLVSEPKMNGAKPTVEDLGSQLINGVMAKGTRSTVTIPAGEIGNDRAIQVVSERWYSDELHMIVKSSNSDPRFGTTEFNLKNILRGEPDPTLFQIPADYAPNKPALRTQGFPR
jgi:hypothetical protein